MTSLFINENPPPSLVLPGLFTVDTLPPAGSGYLNYYARVTDLFGEKQDLVLCSKVGSVFFWQPVRPEYAKTMSGNQDLTLLPLKTPSILFLNDTLSASRTITPSKTGAFPGQFFEVAFNGTLGIFGLTIAGLIGNSTLSMLAGGRRRIFFDGTDWQQFQ